MPLSHHDMAAHPRLREIILDLARGFVASQQADPRMTGIFGTQQRWLLAHAALALHCRGRTGHGPGLCSADFLALIEDKAIAARHTGHAFLMEMLKYGVLAHDEARRRGRTRYMTPSEPALQAIAYWLGLHLAALDAFDGGDRRTRFMRAPAGTELLQPVLADLLVTSPAMRVPGGPFSIFTWLNNGGLVMDWVMVSLKPDEADGDRVPTGIGSVTELAERIKLSRTHLGRKLREAESMGGIGWAGARGRSTMWISRDFCGEYDSYQIEKLVLVDRAFAAVSDRMSPP